MKEILRQEGTGNGRARACIKLRKVQLSEGKDLKTEGGQSREEI